MTAGRVTVEDAAGFERCMAAGGVAILPTDTVYGLACDPESPSAVERLHHLKGRSATRAAAVMFFRLESAMEQLTELGERSCAALECLLPGPVTAIVADPADRYPLAGGSRASLGIRVPDLHDELAPLRAVARPVLQSSANPTGGGDVRRLGDVPEAIREGVDLVLDGGELPGVASTVVDLTGLEAHEPPKVIREGAVPASEIEARIGSL